MKNFIIILAACALFSCKDKEKPFCEQDGSGSIKVTNSNPDTVTVKLYIIVNSVEKYSTAFVVPNGQSHIKYEASVGSYTIRAFSYPDEGTLISNQSLNVQQCKETAVNIP